MPLLLAWLAFAPASADDACTVSGQWGLLAVEAQVVGEQSTVRQGLARSRAWLEADVVRMKRGLFTARIGLVEGEVVVVRRGLVQTRSEPIAAGTVSVPRGIVRSTYRYDEAACSVRQVALGAAHLEAVRADLHEDRASFGDVPR